METQYYKSIRSYFTNGLCLLLVFLGVQAYSQVEEPQDSVKTGTDLGTIQIANPTSIVDAYTYDPKTDRYIYTSTFEGFNINYPIILTPQEYQKLVLKESMRDYFQKKTDAIDGKKDGSEEAKKDLLPRYYVNSSFFETIFGSNTIDVKPTGSVEMDLGVRFTKQDNPAFSPRNRKTTTFDFDQRISMSLTGKVGTRLNVNANYDTESTFAFQNLIKLDYSPTEDDIIQKIEVGNVSMPLNSTLIRGAQSLFGVKAQLQFGKTTVTGVFSEQKSQTRSVTAQGGGTIQDFEIFALDYDSDRHFFLSQYFRNKYDEALKNYPFINSRVQITRIDVWVTNRQNRVSTTGNNLRNIIGIQDLGEAQLTEGSSLTPIPDNQIVAVNPIPGPFFINPFNSPSDNSNNQYDPDLIPGGTGLLNNNIREIISSSQGFNNTVSEGIDYSKLENARKLTANEYTYHPQLGYISLQQRLANDEVLAVAYEYTIGDQVYQVGEFGTDGSEATVVESGVPQTQTLILKLLKSNLTSIEKPIWNLMMKNIYQIPGGFQLQQEDFKFNILYTDPSPVNYIDPANTTSPFPNPTPGYTTDQITNTPLLKVFNIDRLNYNNDPQDGGDGFFDFIPGLTVDQQNGRLIFTSVEPFGKMLFEKLRTNPGENYFGDEATLDYNDNQRKYVYTSMYTKTQAFALQQGQKNKFQLRGKFKSAGGDGIPIGAYNVPRGSVVVTAGGRVLVEGVDYSVNYQAGRVQILDPSLQASNTPIEVSVENNSVFGQQTRRFFGVNIEHKFSEKFIIGGTFLKMTERPFTQKSNYGQESVNNSIFGFNANYSTEVPFFTRMVNKLPNLDTDVASNFSFRGEIAYLKPDTPKADKFEGEATIYIDDFEGSQSNLDLRSPLSWTLSSTPVLANTGLINPEYTDFLGSDDSTLAYNYKRAKLSWYTIDPTFYTESQSGISQEDLELNKTRRVYNSELFPELELAQGQTTVVNTFDLTYYPQERGPYNFNPAAASNNLLPNPSDNFGGITRALNSTNFEQANVEYIQFWMMDPYFDPEHPEAASPISNDGRLYFNLGEISEDVLRDGAKLYENGLPDATGSQPVNQTQWGKQPASTALIYAFDSDAANRAVQDTGFDGLSDAEEAIKYPQFAGNPDPAGDNYQYFLQAGGNDVVNRYKNYNNTQANSPVEVTDSNRGSTTLPDVEDINRDYTMSTTNAYFEYFVTINNAIGNPTNIGTNYVTDVRIVEVPESDPPLRAKWIQFKIPIANPQRSAGGITDFRSIRFMRMFMTGFDQPITLRFGTLDLVRGEWRRYISSLEFPADNPEDDGTLFDVTTVNLQDNSSRSPIPYVSPPGVDREVFYQQNTAINQNEQSLSLRVSGDNGLRPGDSRAVFKNVSIDMRQFKKLKMFLHAEALVGNEGDLADDEMVAFIRFGNDLTDNYYQVELPLKLSSLTARTAEEIWPEINEMDLSIDLLTQLKIRAMSEGSNSPEGVLYYNEEVLDESLINKPNKLRLGVKGNPNFGLVRNLMVGIKNQTNRFGTPRDIKGEVWFNELRIADMDNKGGYAAVASIDTNLADFATVSATGKKSTIGFGGLEEGPNERSREDMLQYNIVTNLSLGKLLPKKWNINLPFNYSVGEETITPEYDPYNQDIRLDQLLDNTTDPAQRSNIKNRAIDYTKRKSINFIGVKKERGEKQKSHFYDPENLTLSYSYNEVEKHNYELENYKDQLVNTAADYNYAFKTKTVEPFKKVKTFSKSEYWNLLKDFNFNYLPSNISFSSNINRQFNKQQFRLVDVEGIGLGDLYRRNFLFNYQYGFNYNLTKSLKLNFTAASNNIVRNYLNEDNVPDNSYTIWTDYWNIGTPNQHTQQLTANYTLPISKIPFLSFVKADYTYTGDYNWQRASLALSEINLNGIDYNLGNTVQNAASHRLNTTLSMDTFYKYIGLVKKTKKAPAKPAAAPKPGEKVVAKAEVQNEGSKVGKFFVGLLTSLKTFQVDYTENRGTVLPGYLPSIGFFGSAKPSLGFAFGMQDEVRFEAAKNGWLTNYPEFNQSFTQVTNKKLNFTANLEPIPDLKIDLNGNRTYADNFSEQYDISADGQYNSRSPYNTGNFAISTVMIRNSFKVSDQDNSAAFEDFRNNRRIIAFRLAEQRGIDTSLPANLGPDGYPIGYGKNSQAVLIPSLLAAYTGFGISNHKAGEAAGKISFSAFREIPLPNWNIKYTGLMKLDFFKEKFKRFSIQHTYKASYTVNSFRSNFQYNNDPNGVDQGGNFNTETIIGNINLVEQFSPLARVDFETKNAFKVLAEVKKDRSISLSFDNNLLTEVKGIEYVVGFGYRIKDVIFTSKFADTPTGVIKSDLNFKIDFSFRNNETIVRYLDYDNNQIAGGQNIWSGKLTMDYSFTKSLTAIFFYDHSFSKAVISTSFPLTNIRSGITLRYNFGN